jgi:hypothetical protein
MKKILLMVAIAILASFLRAYPNEINLGSRIKMFNRTIDQAIDFFITGDDENLARALAEANLLQIQIKAVNPREITLLEEIPIAVLERSTHEIAAYLLYLREFGKKYIPKLFLGGVFSLELKEEKK